MSPVPPAHIRVTVPATQVWERVLTWMTARLGSAGSLIAAITTFLGILTGLRIAWRKFVQPPAGSAAR